MNYYTLIVSLLGAAKIVLEAFGIHIIDNGQINSIADGLASVLTIVGVFFNHKKVDPAPVATTTATEQK